MENTKGQENKELEQNNDCVELSEDVLETIAGGKVPNPPERLAN